MDEKAITFTRSELPVTIDDLSKFVLIGRDKLTAVRAEIAAIKKVGLASEVLEQKRAEAQEIAELVTLSEMRMGEMLSELPTAQGQRNDLQLSNTSETKLDILEDIGISKITANRFEQMAAHPEIVEQAIAEARENDDIVSRASVLRKIKAERKKQEILEAQQSIIKQADDSIKPTLYIGDSIGRDVGKYDLLLTDPPYSTDVDDVEQFARSWLYGALDGVRDTGFAYVFIGAYPDEVRAYLNADIPPHIELTQLLVWTYRNTLGNNPKDRYKLNYQMCLFYRGKNAPHLDCPITNEQWAVQDINAPDGRLWGISSRFQVGKSWETFTIRLERESGVMTEYEKRKIAIERNGEYPYLTIQGYVTDDGKEELTSLAIARTKDIFECIDSGYRTLQHTRHDKCGQASFYVVKWEDMVRLGYPIVIYSNGAIRVYKGDEQQ